MSDMMGMGTGAAAIRHGELRFNASLAKLTPAAHGKQENVNPVTVVTEAQSSAADNNLGKVVDMKT